MNWKSIIKALKAEGYTGGDEDVTGVERFIKSNRITLKHEGQPVDVREIFNKKADVGGDKVTQLENELRRMKSRVHNASAIHKATSNEEPKMFSIGNSVRKSYDRKAKIGRDYEGIRQTSFASSDEAELFGAWVKCAVMPNLASKDDKALITKANITTTNTSGGATIPDIFVPSLIDLKEIRGAGRKILSVMSVASDVVQMPRRVGGITVSWAGEGNTITESNPTVNMVQVTANKMTALTYVSNELLNDSAISFGDLVAREHSYGMADKEDEAIFNGDGTSTYGGHTGFRAKLKSLNSDQTYIAGLVQASSGTYSSMTLADFEAVVGRLPSYADTANPVWVMHKEFYWNVAARLAIASGGVTSTEVINGIATPRFLGYPVIYSQVMPRVTGTAQVCALFGAFDLAAKATQVGGGLQIASDTSVGFASDTTAFRGTNRFGITVHDVGNASATSSARVAGPVVGLITPA
jgi:HK97 family phage major capsid protein